MTTQSEKIAALNDKARNNPVYLKRLLSTRAVSEAFTGEQQMELLQLVRSYDKFHPDHDPNGEHDMGIIKDFYGRTVWWKIDAYAKGDSSMGSEDPSDATKTDLVLTVLFPEDY